MHTCRFSLRRVKSNIFSSDKSVSFRFPCLFFYSVIQPIADKTVLIAPVLIWRIATLSLGSAFLFFLIQQTAAQLVGHEPEAPSLENWLVLIFFNFWKRNRLEAIQDVKRSGWDSQGFMNAALQTLKLFHGPDSLYVCCPEGKASYLIYLICRIPEKPHLPISICFVF